MTPANLQPSATEIDRILECAVILNWHDLMRETRGKIHIECSNGTDRTLEFLKIWSSTIRGNWSLVCEYWMHPRVSSAAGLSFSNGYASAALSGMLEMIMQHQKAFHSNDAPLAEKLIQVDAPSPRDVSAAERCMQTAMATAA